MLVVVAVALSAAARRAWSEGVHIGDDATLERIVEEAGLDWATAKAALDSEGWREEIEANRQALLGMGVWGVPSFRVRGGCTAARSEPDP